MLNIVLSTSLVALQCCQAEEHFTGCTAVRSSLALHWLHCSEVKLSTSLQCDHAEHFPGCTVQCGHVILYLKNKVHDFESTLVLERSITDHKLIGYHDSIAHHRVHPIWGEAQHSERPYVCVGYIYRGPRISLFSTHVFSST